jgi:hypothetical protein
MGLFDDMLSGDTDDARGEGDPAERILQLRRGISAAAAALPGDRREFAREAVEAADALADRVAELVETPGPGEGIDVEAPEDGDGDAAGWLREGPARRREAGGPAGSDVATAERVPGDVAREGAERLDRLHFALLRMEILREDPAELRLEETVLEIRSLAERLGSGDGTGGTGPGAAEGEADG